MAQIVKLKRTAVSGKVPTTSNLELGELAMNTFDGRIFFEKDSGTPTVNEILTTNTENYITGSLMLNGSITASSGIQVSADIMPTADNSFSLGSSTVRFQLNGGTPVTVDGSGTANRLTRFQSATTVENSTIVSSDTETIFIHSNNGNNIFTVSGSNGELLTVTDSNTGNLLEVNDTSGIDVFTVSAVGDVSASGAITASGIMIIDDISVTGNISGSTFNGTGLLSGSITSQLPSGVVSGSQQIRDLGFVSASNSFTANEIIIADDTDSVTSTNLLTIDPDNSRVGVGTSSPGTKFHISGEGSNEGQIRLQQANNGSDGPDIAFYSSRGTIASPNAIQNGDTHGRINAYPYNGTSYIQAGSFGWSGTDGTGNNTFDIRSRVSGTLAKRIEITSIGKVKFNDTYEFPTSDGTNGQALITNGSGVLSFGDVTSDYTELSNIPSGIISESLEGDSQGQIKLNNQNINVNALGTDDSPTFTNLVLTGNLTVQGTTTTENSQEVNIGDNILNLNYGGSATEGGILVSDGTGASTTSGSLKWDSTNDYWKAGKLGSEEEILLRNTHGVISSSQQVVDSLSNQDVDFGTGDITATIISGSYIRATGTGNSLLVEDTLRIAEDGSGLRMTNVGAFESASEGFHIFSNSDLRLSTNGSGAGTTAVIFDQTTKDATFEGNILAGNISGSSFNGTGLLSGSITDQLPSGVVSGSSQITDGSGIVSGSSQLSSSFESLIINSTTPNTDLLTLMVSESHATTPGPIFALSRYNESPFDGDNLGQIEFRGRSNDGGVDETTFAKITGVIQDSSGGTADGQIEFRNIRNNTDTLTARLKSDKFQLLNNTSLEVAGNISGSSFNGTGLHSGSQQVVDALLNQDLDLGTGDIDATSGSFENLTVTSTTPNTDTFKLLVSESHATTPGPIFVLGRFNESPFDGDNLGQIEFRGRSGLGGVNETTFAKITGVIQDSSDASKDGQIEFRNIKDNTETLTARLKSDKFELLNGTSLEVSGNISGSSFNGTGLLSGSGQLSGYISASGGFTANETIIATGTNSVTSSNILALDTTNNYLGINQTSPEVTLHMTGEGAQSAQIRMEQHNDTSDAPDIRTRKSRGTSSAPTKNNAGDFIYRQNSERYNGSSYVTVGQLAIDANSSNADRFQLTLTVSEDGGSIDAANNQFKIDGNDGGAITFNNAYKFPTSDGTNGQVLQTNGSGVLSFGTVSGYTDSDNTDHLNSLGVVSGSLQVVSLLDNQNVDLGTGDITASNISVAEYIKHEGDTDTYIQFNPNDIQIFAGNELAIRTTSTKTVINENALDRDFRVASNNNNNMLFVDAGNDRIHIGEATGGDKTLNVRGDVSASAYYGDGSNLTGVSADVVESATISDTFTNQSSITVTHNFGTKNVLVSVYGNDDNQIVPESVSLTDTNTVQVELSYSTSGFIVVAKGGHLVSGSISYSDIANNPFSQTGNFITASGHIVPSLHETYDLGSTTRRWRDLYLSGSTIDLGGTLITRDGGTGDINFKDSATEELKTVIVKELQIGTGASARKVKVESGKIKFADKDDVETVDDLTLPSGVVSGSAQITDLTTHKETVSGNTSYTVTHNLNEQYPIVQAWNTSTSQQEIPESITTNSANQVTVTFVANFAGVIIVKK